MSMTREEAITLLKYRRNIISSVDADWNANEIEAINFALSALLPVSREQVERLWPGAAPRWWVLPSSPSGRTAGAA